MESGDHGSGLCAGHREYLGAGLDDAVTLDPDVVGRCGPGECDRLVGADGDRQILRRARANVVAGHQHRRRRRAVAGRIDGPHEVTIGCSAARVDERRSEQQRADDPVVAEHFVAEEASPVVGRWRPRDANPALGEHQRSRRCRHCRGDRVPLAELRETLEVLTLTVDEGATEHVPAEPQTTVDVGVERPGARCVGRAEARHPVTLVVVGDRVEHPDPVVDVGARVVVEVRPHCGVAVDPGVGVAALHHLVAAELDHLGVATLVGGHVAAQQLVGALGVHLRVVLRATVPDLVAEVEHGELVLPAHGRSGPHLVGETRDDLAVVGPDGADAAASVTVHATESAGHLHGVADGVDVERHATHVRTEGAIRVAVRNGHLRQPTQAQRSGGSGDVGEVAADVDEGAFTVDRERDRSSGGPTDGERSPPCRVHCSRDGVDRCESPGSGNAIDVGELTGDDQATIDDLQGPDSAVELWPERRDPRARLTVERGEIRVVDQLTGRRVANLRELATDVHAVTQGGDVGNGYPQLRLGVAERIQADDPAGDLDGAVVEHRGDGLGRQARVGDGRWRSGGQRRANEELCERQRLVLGVELPEIRRVVALPIDRASVRETRLAAVAAPGKREPAVEVRAGAVSGADLAPAPGARIPRIRTGASCAVDRERCESVAAVERP